MVKNLFIYLIIIINSLNGMQSSRYNMIHFQTGQDNSFKHAIDFDQDNGNVYVGQQALEIWDQTGRLMKSIEQKNPIHSLSVGNAIFGLLNQDSNAIDVYDKSSFKKIKTLDSQNYKKLARIKIDPRKDTIAAWDLNDDKQMAIKLIQYTDATITEIPISPNANLPTFEYQYTPNSNLLINFMDVEKYEDKCPTVKHKIEVYSGNGSPAYVWDVPQYTWPDMATTDVEDNIIMSGGSDDIYYYQPNGTLIKKLTGHTSFWCKPVISNRTNTLYYFKQNSAETMSTLVGVDPETDTTVAEISFTSPSDAFKSQYAMFLDQQTQNIIIAIGKNVYVFSLAH